MTDKRQADNRMIALMENHSTILENQSVLEQAFTHQHKCVEELKVKVDELHVMGKEIHALLDALRVTAKMLKWIAIVVSSLAAIWHGVRAVARALW